MEWPGNSEKAVIYFNVSSRVLTAIRSVLTNGASTPSLTFSVRYGTDVSGSGTEVVTGGIVTTSTTAGDNTTALSNPTIPANNFVWFTTSAVSGTVPQVNITLV